MAEWLSKIAQEWAVIQSAPLSFITVCAIAAAGIWGIVIRIYGIRLTNKDGEISLLTRQRDDYKDKLGGASPDQAKAKIDALEKRIERVVLAQSSDTQVSESKREAIDQAERELSDPIVGVIILALLRTKGAARPETILQAVIDARFDKADPGVTPVLIWC